MIWTIFALFLCGNEANQRLTINVTSLFFKSVDRLFATTITVNRLKRWLGVRKFVCFSIKYSTGNILILFRVLLKISFAHISIFTPGLCVPGLPSPGAMSDQFSVPEVYSKVRPAHHICTHTTRQTKEWITSNLQHMKRSKSTQNIRIKWEINTLDHGWWCKWNQLYLSYQSNGIKLLKLNFVSS